MLDVFLPSKDDNLFESLNPENQPDLLSTSHPYQNPLNPGFGEQLKAFDNPVSDFDNPLWEAVLEPDETEFDPSLVDLLTGEVLQNFAADPHFDDKISLAFGENWNREVVKDLQQDWLFGDFSDIPQVRILSADVLPAANGAYSRETNTIYLSRDFLTENAANPAAIADVLLEEYGHAIDAKINAVDAAGDEGEILSSIVRGEALSDGELLALKVEDDAGMIVLDGEEIAIEQAKFKPKAGGDRVVDIIRQERGSWMDNNRDAEIYLSKGDWNFNKQSTLPNMGDFNGDLVNMVTGDFNGDGLTDFIRQEKGRLIDGYRDAEVYLAAGNGTFRSPIQMTNMSAMNGNLVNLVAGDFNGDGKTDIIRQEKGSWVDGRSDAEILLSNGNGTFGNSILMNNASAMNGDFVNLIVGDFTGDGADDIIRQEKGNWVNGVNDVEFLTFSRGNFGKVKNVPDMPMMNGNFVNLIAGDFNGDRIIDLIRQEKGSWVNGSRDAEIYISDGRWNFRSVTVMNNAWWMNGDNVNLIAGDFTGGGADDIIRQEKGGWVDGGNDVEFLTYSGGNFNKVKDMPDMGAMNGNFVTLVPGLFGSSADSINSQTPQVNALHSNPKTSNPLRGFQDPLRRSNPPAITWNHNSWAGQQYAVDFGANSSGATFGKSVYAMRSGTVVSWRDTTQDKNTNLGYIDDGKKGTTANFLVVKLDDSDGVDDGYRAMYLHLQQGSIPSQLKQVGARVETGSYIGKVGYNGVAQGVHLHVEVNQLTGSGSNMWSRETVPFQW